tara:strand:+ start:185 stop:616 length:432 start_codon:yes stop_codon:yes gene_type:complete
MGGGQKDLLNNTSNDLIQENKSDEKITHRYQNELTLEKRLSEFNRIRGKYPDRIPIIIEKSETNSNNMPDLDKHKFLVPSDISLAQFMYVLRQRIKLKSKVAIFLFINNKLISTSSLIGEIYNQNKHIDNFLYIKYAGENTFG